MKNNTVVCRGGVFRKTLFILLFLVTPLLAFADDYLHFGINYSPTISAGSVSHAIGGYVSSIGDYGGAKKVYSAIGFTAGLSNPNIAAAADFRKLGLSDFHSRAFAVPLRIGYPFFIKVNESIQFNIIPSLAMDVQFFNCSFKQNYAGFRVDYTLSGWGYSLGFSANVGMQHKINKIYLRYGVDVDVPFITLLIYDVSYSGAVSGKMKDATAAAITDTVSVTASPYVSIGFKL